MNTIKILLVDDDPEKIRIISECVLGVEGFTSQNIEYVHDAASAKRLLSTQKFDLVILDINIPPSPNKVPTKDGGIAVLKFLKNNLSAVQPSYILGITAIDEAFAEASSEFESPIWKLIRFSFQDTSWKEPLRQSLSHLLATIRPPYFNDGNTFRYDLGIFVALEDEELDSIRALPGDWQELRVDHDHSRYFVGEFKNGQNSVSVVAVAAPKMGMPAAGVTATMLISTFRPRYLAITGICAGVRGKARIGDILVADPCFDWGSGKWRLNEKTKKPEFLPAPYPWRLDADVRSEVNRCADENGLLGGIHAAFKGKKPKLAPRVKVEAMASGGSVLQAKALMGEVRDQHKNLVGVEMESYAVFTAAQYSANPRPTCISIKAVCDFGDEKKADGYHRYAAHNSAQFLYNLAIRSFSGRK